MNYYKKNIDKVNFYGIKYRKISNINDYSILKKEVEGVLYKANKVQFLIDAENLCNSAKEEKDGSMCVNLPLCSSLLFGISAFVLGVLTESQGIGDFFTKYGICVILYMLLVCLLVNRAKSILKLCNKKIEFYDTICKIIKEK